MNHHAVLLNHLSRQTDAVLLPLVVVLGNGCETECVRNIKVVLLNCFGMVEGYQEMLSCRLFTVWKNALFSSWWALLNQITSIDFYFQVNDKELELMLDWDLFCLTWSQALWVRVQMLWEVVLDTPISVAPFSKTRFLFSSVALQRCHVLVAANNGFGVWSWGFWFHISLMWIPLLLDFCFHVDPNHVHFCPFCKNNVLYSKFGTVWCSNDLICYNPCLMLCSFF